MECEIHREKKIKCELFNDNFQNFKRYNIPKAQLVIADIPYNVGTNFYGSNPMWYNGGDNKNGESKLAGKAAFNTDFNFNIAEYFHFCNRLLKPEPINTEMVRAILDGRKNVTRRVVKPQPNSKLAYACMGYKHGTWGYPDKNAWKYWNDESYKLPDGIAPEELERRWTPPCHTGDILYVRETWDNEPVTPGGHFRQRGVWYYKADGDLRPEGWRGNWHPSIHMPKEAARLFLRATDVRVERLLNIARTGALKEGANPTCAVLNFKRIWNTTIKPADLCIYGWEANPWVWVIEFERISKEEAYKNGR